MGTELKRILFGFIITSIFYIMGREFDIPLFILGWWCGLIFAFSEKHIYFLLFPRQQKYVIRLTHKYNKYKQEWLTSMNPEDRYVKSNIRRIALRFDTEKEAREVLQALQGNKVGWELYYADVKKFYV